MITVRLMSIAVTTKRFLLLYPHSQIYFIF